MELNQVTSLAKHLRDSGNKILTSEYKLTLSGSIIKGLNDSFSLITHESESTSASGFQVVKPLSTKSDVLEDLHLVYDFIQKTLALCIINYREEQFKEIVDLNRFRSLVKLEIQKYNIDHIVGIQKLRPQLKHLICVKCLKDIDDIIVRCGKDNSNGFVWNELHTADFSYNNFKKCDNSLEFASYLQDLNLSHNLLTSVEAVKWLPHLKVLNLSFNRLNSIPNFHIDANRKLKILIINNNLIEVIDLHKFEALTNLDLSYNFLIDHSNLISLSTCCNLKILNLLGNALSCHSKHRENTVKYLHENAKENFVLDCKPLSKYEASLTGKIKIYNPIHSYRSLTQINRTSGISTPIQLLNNADDSSNASSFQSFQMKIHSKKNSNKKSNPEIIDLDVKTPEKSPNDNLNKTEKKFEPQMIIEQKQIEKTLMPQTIIEQLRNEHGENWLQEQNSKQMVESILGLEDTKTDKMDISLIDELLFSNNLSNNSKFNSMTSLSSKSINIKSENDDEDIYEENKESADSNKTVCLENNTQNNFDQTIQVDILPKEDHIFLSNDTLEEEQFSEPEDSEDFFIGYVNNSEDEIFLTISDTKFRERDALTKRTLAKWSLQILEACERVKSDTLRINFDTINKEKKERLYKIEEKRCQLLENQIRSILSQRSLSEMNQQMYSCIQCLSKFSREYDKYNNSNIVIECPECQSKFVVEVNESPKSKINSNANKLLPTVDSKSYTENKISNLNKPLIKPSNESQSSLKNNLLQEEQKPQSESSISQSDKQGLEESASHSSIAKGVVWKQSNKALSSAGSLNESSSCSKISQNSFDSNQSVAGSSSNERDNDFNNMGIDNNKYYNDSEVEILSNPSQSSIEVLDTYQSSRKTSEERRISRIPSLETIEDNSIKNFCFKMTDNITTEDLISGIGIINDNNKTITSADSTADFLKKEIKQTLAEQKLKNNENFIEKIEQDDIINKPILSVIEKKINIGHLNLTESSSSGSVTDSICTTYEQENKSNESESKDDESKDEKDLSFISNILGGIFQTTNKLLSKSEKSLDTNESNLTAKFKFNYNDFGDVDYRLKYNFMLTKFNENEFFKCLIKGKIFETNSLRYYEAIVVMSTNKLYIMEINGPESEDITKWLKEILNVSIDRMGIQLLPFKTGLSLTIKGFSEMFLLFLQDILRTDSLLLFFANNPLPDCCSLEYQISEIVMGKMLNLTNNNKIKMFSILNSFECKLLDNELIKPAGFYITDEHLYVTKSNLSWLYESFDKNIDILSVQKMSNLVEVKKLNSILEIYFSNEIIDSQAIWKCEFGTQENLETFLNAIEQSWEKIFGVSLLNN